MPHDVIRVQLSRRTRVRGVSLLVSCNCLLALSACGVFHEKPDDFSKRKYERVAPTISVQANKNAGTLNDLLELQRAQQLLQAGDFAGAEKEARKVVKSSPNSFDAHTVLALALDSRGKTSEAGDHYRKAAELAPTRGEALNNYGTWLCMHGNAGESLGWFQRAMSAPGYPTPVAALGNSGACALQAGDLARADRELHRAVELAPTNPVVLGALAELELAQGNALEARAFSERRLAAAPADVHSLQIASQIEQKLGDSDAAARYVRRMKTEFPQSGTSRNGESKTP